MAFTEGVRPGGLSNSREIKILICYMLSGANTVLNKNDIRDILVHNQIANMFEVVDAMEDLISKKTIFEDEKENIGLTDTGKLTSEQLAEMIPYSLREQALKATMQLITRSQTEKDTKVEIKEIGDRFSVTCSIDTNEHPMMSFTLQVADKHQAELIKNNFINDPTSFYKTLIAVATADYKKTSDQIIIDSY